MPIGMNRKNHIKKTVDALPIGTEFTVMDIVDSFKTKHGPTRIECAMCLLQLDNVIHLKKGRNQKNIWIKVSEKHE